MTSATSVRMASNVRTRNRRKTFQSLRHLRRRGTDLVWGLAPFYWMVITSFRDVKHLRHPWWPACHLQNFRDALSTARATTSSGAIVNSLLIGAVTTPGSR